MSGRFIQDVANTDTHGIGQQQFCDLLRRSWLFHRQARAKHLDYDCENHQDQETHYDLLRYWQCRIFRLDVQRIQNRKNK